MSCFGKGCKKKKKRSDSSRDKAVQKLEETRKMLTKQQEDLEQEIDSCTSTAKENAITNKRVALRALQRKKYLIKKLEKVDTVLNAVEMHKEALEDAPTTAAIIACLGDAGCELRKTNTTLNTAKVQDLMDNITEQYSVSDDITDVIRNSIMLEADDDVFKELEELETEKLNEKLIRVPDITTLPTMQEGAQADVLWKTGGPSNNAKDAKNCTQAEIHGS